MQLEKMTARVRPRIPWEAVDLGFMMVQKWWGRIVINWIIISLPVFVLINLLSGSHFVLAAITFWWLKPVFERVPLHIISRALFGELEPNSKIIKAIPSLIFSNLIKSLTYLRLDPARSFTMPVWQLERLKGRKRSERARVLNRKVSTTTFGLLLMCLMIEFIMFLSLLGVVLMLTPDYYQQEIIKTLTFEDNQTANWAGWVINSFIYLCYLIVEPFYVAGGFALYINRRTELEGWDIEIVFRRLAQRLKQPATVSSAAVLLLAGLLALTGFPSVSHAQGGGSATISNAEAKKSIEEILATDEFKDTQTVTSWRRKDGTKSQKPDDLDGSFNLSGLGAGFGLIGELLLWAMVVGLLILGIIAYQRWSPAMTPGRQSHKQSKPKSLFGLEITPESLPDDVAAEAMKFWNQNEPLKALSLLYRGALTILVHRDGINLKGSSTEGDCIRIVQANGQMLASAQRHYFTDLTRTWQQAAYAHRLPGAEVMSVLAKNWGVHFG